MAVVVEHESQDMNNALANMASTTPASTCSVAQRGIKLPMRPLQRYTQVRSKRSLELYKVDKYYIGLLKELPPPEPVQQKWDQDIQSHLEQRVCEATRLLPSMRDDEVITELVLCMAGKKCSPTAAPLEPGAVCPKDPVALNPTVWIHCGSRKCRKKVLEAVRLLKDLENFLVRFSMEPPHASLYAPWPAAEEYKLQSLHSAAIVKNTSMDIQNKRHRNESICGTRAKFTVETSLNAFGSYSTIGGVIVVGDSIFGLTTAHSMVSCWLNVSHDSSSHKAQTAPDSPLSADSDSDTTSDSDNSSTEGAQSPSQSPKMLSPETKDRPKLDIVAWMPVQMPTILAYMGRGTLDGDFSLPIAAPDMSDFALLQLENIEMVRANEYHDPETFATIPILDHIPTEQLTAGNVRVIAGQRERPIEGYLLEGNASIILKGTVMRTKKIQISLIDAHGLSGSWVVRDGKLCGVIYAAYSQSPYLHMLPAEQMFQDIANVVQVRNVRVATPEDLFKYLRPQDAALTQDDGTIAQGNQSNAPVHQYTKIENTSKPLVLDSELPGMPGAFPIEPSVFEPRKLPSLLTAGPRSPRIKSPLDPWSSDVGASFDLGWPDSDSVLQESYKLSGTSSDPAISEENFPLFSSSRKKDVPRSYREGIGSSYRRISSRISRRSNHSPLSPAASFLAHFNASEGEQQPALPDDEGQCIGYGGEYVIGKQIGFGGFSAIKEATTFENGAQTIYAVKIVRKALSDKRDAENEELQDQFDHEVEIWRFLRHPYILPLLRVYVTDFATFCIMPLQKGGTLFDLVRDAQRKKKTGLSSQTAKRFAYQLASALRYLHEDVRVVHRDIKLENCLVDTSTPDAENFNGDLLLCDFGMADFIVSDLRDDPNLQPSQAEDNSDPSIGVSTAGSLQYAAPEIIKAPVPIFSPTVDIWAFGVCVYTLLSGRLPFNSNFEPKIVTSIQKGEWDMVPVRDAEALQTEGLDEATSLLRGCLEVDPEKRWSIKEVLSCDWLEGCSEKYEDVERSWIM